MFSYQSDKLRLTSGHINSDQKTPTKFTIAKDSSVAKSAIAVFNIPKPGRYNKL